jgi:hypothetical protein
VDAKDQDGIRMGGNVVQEVMGLLHGVFGGCGLGGGECAEGNQNGSVDGAAVVEYVPITCWIYFLSSLDMTLLLFLQLF